jgi:CubicO group peptidase (beta-lactamase class C family)
MGMLSPYSRQTDVRKRTPDAQRFGAPNAMLSGIHRQVAEHLPQRQRFSIQGDLRMHRAMYVPALSLAMCAASAATQPAITCPDGRKLTPAQIDSTVNRLIQAAHVTGAGVALFHRGKIVYLNAYGLRDTEKALPLTPDSVMTAASLTKSAFATVVMRLVQRGTLDLDKPIEQYLGKPLGDFDHYADLAGDPRTARLTLRILLDHTTGFANLRRLEGDRKLHIHYAPGTHYGYSGEGINLAQLVVEEVTGKSTTALMQEEPYTPLKNSDGQIFSDTLNCGTNQADFANLMSANEWPPIPAANRETVKHMGVYVTDERPSKLTLKGQTLKGRKIP